MAKKKCACDKADEAAEKAGKKPFPDAVAPYGMKSKGKAKKGR